MLLGSSLVDGVFFTGFVGSDDMDYFNGGVALFQGLLGPEILLAETRLTLLIWNALVVELLGPFAQRVAVSYILLHQLLNVATFALGKRLFGPRPALVAVYLFALVPMVIVYSSTILPDIASAAFLVLSLLALSYGLPSSIHTRPVVQAAWMQAAGLLFGLAYGAKESVLVSLPVMVIWGVLHVRRALPGRWIGQSLWLATLFAGGLLVFVGVETIVLSDATDRFFLRLGWTVDDDYSPTLAMIDKYGTDPVERWNWLIYRALDPYTFPHAHKWMTLVCLVAFPFFRGRSWWVFALAIWTFAFFTWGSVSPTKYAPPSLQARYYIQVLPFVALIVGLVCTRVLEWFESWRLPILAGPFALVILFGPWCFLRGANHLPSVIYRADLVGAGMHAVNEARRPGDRTSVVLSGHIEPYVVPVMGTRRRGFISTDAVRPALFHRWLMSAPMRYITLKPSQVHHRYQRISTKVDRALLPMLRQLEQPKWPGYVREAVVVSSPDGTFPDLRMRCRGYYRLPTGRMEVLWRFFTKEPRLPSERQGHAVVWVVDIELVE